MTLRQVGLSFLLPATLLGMVSGATAGRRPGPSPSRPVPATPSPVPQERLASLRVNELGRVPVIEWHEVSDSAGRWKVTRSTFKAQLERLYDEGYRPVTVADFVDGRFDIPAGTSPVLLTFDDAYKEQFWFGEDGEPHPDSAVGIIREFARTHPGWRETAAFYVY